MAKYNTKKTLKYLHIFKNKLEFLTFVHFNHAGYDITLKENTTFNKYRTFNVEPRPFLHANIKS